MSSTDAPILVLGLTPARQQIVRLSALELGAVNRAQEVHWCAAGKVLDVAVALRALGASSRTLTVLGGATGAELRAELRALGVDCEALDCAQPTRVCTTVLDRLGGRARCTELVENASAVSSAQLSAFVARARVLLDRARIVVLSGSLPLRSAAGFWAELLTPLPATGPSLVLDIRGPELLACLERRPLVVKPNREELAQTLGRPLDDEAALAAAAKELRDRGARWVAVSDGARDLHLFGPPGHCALVTPPVEVVNAIGCGDALAAGIAASLARGEDVPSAVRHGVACGASAAETLLPGRLDVGRVATLRSQVVASPWS